MIRRVTIGWVGVTAALLCRVAPGVSLVISDFDDTLVETREEFGGTFVTPMRIFRVERRLDAYQPVSQGPDEVWVTPVEFKKIERYLGSKDSFGITGRLFKVGKAGGPSKGAVVTIDPGIYQLRQESYSFYREGPAGKNHVLRHLKAAVSGHPPGAWQGPFWPYARRWLSHRETARWFGLGTARGHSRSEWEGGFRFLKAQSEIAFLPNFSLFYSLTRSELEPYLLDGNLANAKKELLEGIARKLLRLRLTEKDWRLHPDGKTPVQIHSLIFAEDRPQTVAAIAKTFQSMAQSGIYPIKFVLFNAGNGAQVRATQRPRAMVFQTNGTVRQALEEELLGEYSVLTETTSCQEAIGQAL